MIVAKAFQMMWKKTCKKIVHFAGTKREKTAL